MKNFLDALYSDKGFRIAGVAALGFLALFLAVSTVGALKGMGRTGTPATDVITVTGQGEVTMAPDVARMQATVFHTKASVADAQAETTTQMNDTIALVKTFGIADKDIRTTSYTITPHYTAYQTPSCAPGIPCPIGGQRITGYDVSQSIEITVRDLTKVSELLAGLGTLKVQNVSGPNFALEDTTAGYNAARAKAITQARQQAKLLADQLGVRLSKIISFNENSGAPYPVVYSMGGPAMESKAASAPNVPVGENTYSASVSITYEIR